MSEYSSEIVVGIDFGTTHSGVSWAVNGGSKVIRLINNWPDPAAQNASKDKVPSSICYVNGVPQKWGYTVGLTDESFKWIKILLEDSSDLITKVEPVRNSSSLLQRVHKKPHEVVSDYLRLLWEYTKDDIRKFHPDYESIFAIRVILTVPAVWSPAAKDKTRLAAKLAGLPDAITLVTEPEAAALATLKDKAEESTLKIGDAFVVCDAGGGTVVGISCSEKEKILLILTTQDLISYKIEGLDPLKISECAIGDGGLCGSVFLDLAFERYISTIIGDRQYNKIKETNRKKMMREFEYGIKRMFSEKNDQTYSVDLRGVEDDPRNGIIDDTITVKMDALRVVFDHVSLQIEDLVRKQISEVSDKGLQVKSVLLVGGFGENRYLYDRLEQSHNQNGIQILQVNGAWSSICRGATLWGLEHSELTAAVHGEKAENTVVSRLSRYSYGIAISQPFDQSRHLLQDRFFKEATGVWMAKDQMVWLLKKGEEVAEGRVIDTACMHTVQVGFLDTGSRTFSMELFYNEEARPPTRRTDAVRPLCTVNYEGKCDKLWLEPSFKSPVNKQKYRNATFKLFILLGNATLDFVVVYRNELVGHVEANYAEKF